MYVTEHTITLTTTTLGACTAYSAECVNGRVFNAILNIGGLASGFDATLSTEVDGQVLWGALNVSATATIAPRQPTHVSAGVARVYIASGQAIPTAS